MTAAQLDEIEYEIVRQSFFYSKQRYEDSMNKSYLRQEWNKIHDPYSDKEYVSKQLDYSDKMAYAYQQCSEIVKSILSNYGMFTNRKLLNDYESGLNVNDKPLPDNKLFEYPCGWIRNLHYFQQLSLHCFTWYITFIKSNDGYYHAHPRTRDKIIEICKELLFGG